MWDDQRPDNLTARDFLPDDGQKTRIGRFLRLTAFGKISAVLNRRPEKGFCPCARERVAPVQIMHVETVAADGYPSPRRIEFGVFPDALDHITARDQGYAVFLGNCAVISPGTFVHFPLVTVIPDKTGMAAVSLIGPCLVEHDFTNFRYTCTYV